MAQTDKQTDKQGADEHGSDHGDHSKHYIKIWGVLIVLLVISVLGPMLEIQAVTLATAFGIAFVKAFLVAKHFMHIPLDNKFVTYILVTAVAFMLLLFAGTAPDVMRHDGQNWDNYAAKASVKQGLEAAKHAEGAGAQH